VDENFSLRNTLYNFTLITYIRTPYTKYLLQKLVKNLTLMGGTIAKYPWSTLLCRATHPLFEQTKWFSFSSLPFCFWGGDVARKGFAGSLEAVMDPSCKEWSHAFASCLYENGNMWMQSASWKSCWSLTCHTSQEKWRGVSLGYPQVCHTIELVRPWTS